MMKSKRVVKNYRMFKEYNPFDGKYKYAIRDDENKLVFMGAVRQSIFAFADRLSESGHVVTFDDSVNMSDTQLDELREIEVSEVV